MFEVVSETALAQWVHSTSDSQSAMRNVYEKRLIPRSADKSISRQVDGKALGAQLFEGVRLRPPVGFLLRLVQLTWPR